MTESHENNSDDNDKFMHVCIIIIFLLIKLFYSLIYSLDCLLQFTQFYLMFVNFLNLAAVFSLTVYCI